MGTETKKTVRMDESTENTRRIVTVEQTSRVIKFGDSQTNQHKTYESHQPKATSPYAVPTPKKFVQGQFRESDYESDADYSRIRAKWAPSESETEEPRYRKVQPPTGRPGRSPIITMPSDTETEKSENERRSSSNYMETMRNRHVIETNGLKPGSPPEYVYAPGQEFKKTANRKANLKYFKDFFPRKVTPR